MKVYITKYALTLGIQEREVKEGVNDSVIETSGLLPQTHYIEGKGWHTTRESAIKRAIKMRDSRIKALEKQIEKLKNLTF